MGRTTVIIRGFDLELIKRCSPLLGLDVEYVNNDFGHAGSASLRALGMTFHRVITDTPEREKESHFLPIPYHGRSGYRDQG